MMSDCDAKEDHHNNEKGPQLSNEKAKTPSPQHCLTVTAAQRQGMRSVQTSPARLSAASGPTILRENRGVDDDFFSSNEHNPIPHISDSADEHVKKFCTKQSRQLPPWAWFVVAKILGIKLHPGDKAYIGAGLHLLTLLLALMLVIVFTWYTVYDIVSLDTRSTVLTGLASVVMIIFWSSLGVYGNKLATKLFSSRAFVSSVRLHSKTVFKLSSAGILVAVATTSIGLSNYSTYQKYSDAKCMNITLPAAVCKSIFATQCCYSFFLLVWNAMVGIVLLSVCRTHTIGIRRYIHQLEADGRLYESYRCHSYFQALQGSHIVNNDGFSPSTEDEYLWDDDVSPLSDEYQALPPATNRPVSCHGSVPSTPAHSRPHSYPGPSYLTTTENNHHLQSLSRLDDNGPVEPDDQPLIDFVSDNNVPQSGASNYEGPCAAPSGLSRVLHHPRPAIVIRQSSVTSKEKTDGREVASDCTNQSRDNLTEADQQPWGDMSAHNSKTSAGDGTVRPKMLIKPDPPSQTSRSSHQSIKVEMGSTHRPQSAMSFGSVGSNTEDNERLGPRILSVDDILLCYWRINCRLRTSSLVLQRWLLMWLIFILVYSSSFIISWISHEATLLSIAELVLPLLLLPILTSAYGEVNNEGRRMLKCICPTEERVQMMIMLIKQPLEMTVFGVALSYSSIGTFIGAITIAFCSKIILEEIQL